MWPSVAAGVLLLAALSTWASGVFRQKAPEARIEPKSQTTLAPIAERRVRGQSKAENPVSAGAARSASASIEQKAESRGADARSSGELASVGAGTKGPAKIEAGPRPLTPSEESHNSPNGGPEMAPPRPVAVAERVSPEPDQLPPALGAKATPFDLLRHARRLLKEMKYVKYPQKDKIRNQAVLGLEMAIRNLNQGKRSAPQIDRIKKEIQESKTRRSTLPIGTSCRRPPTCSSAQSRYSKEGRRLFSAGHPLAPRFSHATGPSIRTPAPGE